MSEKKKLNLLCKCARARFKDPFSQLVSTWLAVDLAWIMDGQGIGRIYKESSSKYHLGLAQKNSIYIANNNRDGNHRSIGRPNRIEQREGTLNRSVSQSGVNWKANPATLAGKSSTPLCRLLVVEKRKAIVIDKRFLTGMYGWDLVNGWKTEGDVREYCPLGWGSDKVQISVN